MSRLYMKPGVWAKEVPRDGAVCVVSELRAFKAAGRSVLAALKKRRARAAVFLLPSGEAAKTWAHVSRLLSFMLKAGLSRDGWVVAVGGGAVTDAAGFAAAIYLRGISWISVPTTALGQLDGGIGGKTAINLPEGKNLAGAFHEPAAIACDPGVLAKLPSRERAAGLAEALKIGLVFEPALWRDIERNWLLLAGNAKALADVVRRAAGWKLRVVAKDPRETRGQREWLNFGHTIGHALETVAGHGRLRHGEAVVWGMRAALRLSVAAAGLPLAQADEAEDFLEKIAVPLPRGLSIDKIMKAAKRDKKIRDGSLRFVLLRGLGKPVTMPVDGRLARAVVESLL